MCIQAVSRSVSRLFPVFIWTKRAVDTLIQWIRLLCDYKFYIFNILFQSLNRCIQCIHVSTNDYSLHLYRKSLDTDLDTQFLSCIQIAPYNSSSRSVTTPLYTSRSLSGFKLSSNASYNAWVTM